MWLLRLLTGSGGIAGELRRAYEARLAAETDADRMAAEVAIARLEARLESHRIGGRWITAVQVLWALPFVTYNAKLIVWDKVFGLGATDPLSPELYALQGTIVAFFFLTTGINTAIRTLRR